MVTLVALCQHYVLEKSAPHAEHCQHRDPFDRSIDKVSIIIVIIVFIIMACEGGIRSKYLIKTNFCKVTSVGGVFEIVDLVDFLFWKL